MKLNLIETGGNPMSEPMKNELNVILNDTKSRLIAIAKFYKSAGERNLHSARSHGAKVILSLAREHSKTIETVAERVLWTLNRPLGKFTMWISAVDAAHLKAKRKSKVKHEENRLAETEVVRMEDEGGPAYPMDAAV